ncbi:hypothetical protein AYX14_06543 [Cryptococcus neoformans]|nr:hypothetical protein AYX14_06543 [Cryptococcus neoformans var. grubii]OXG13304.1 hypothetical protein C366_05187 [Cryptococcus neoformans var. grubii Tu401-1]OXM77110.1 hypothetical protein C364_05174 [Cryptococcus neoformans var. grubii Bt63]
MQARARLTSTLPLRSRLVSTSYERSGRNLSTSTTSSRTSSLVKSFIVNYNNTRSFTNNTGKMSKNTECCPPQSNSNPSKPNVPHPTSDPIGYKYNGEFKSVANYDKVYVTGPESAKHALVVIYDIFGFWDTTIKGSDTLVSHLASTFPTKVLMPDVFKGKPFPADKDGDKETLQKFFATTAKLDERLPEVLDFAKELQKSYEKVSILGYCWGGKLTLLSLAEGTPFNAGAVAHPAMIAPEDGEKLSVPLGFYPSHDEPKDVVEKIVNDFKSKPFGDKCGYHLYDTVHHGWAAARANLNDPENVKQFEDVYKRLSEWFASVKA